jgi:protein-disulfide isomerase
VLGTPTLFINGVIHQGGYDPPTLLAALAAKAENRWLVARLR